MRHAICLAAALLLATSASAADPKKKDDASAGTKPRAAETPREKMDKKKAAKGGANPKKAEPSTAEAADRATALRAKSLYMYAVEACEQPVRCDAALREDAEQRFMDACRVCASQERCETERAAIKEGSTRRSADPCAR